MSIDRQYHQSIDTTVHYCGQVSKQRHRKYRSIDTIVSDIRERYVFSLVYCRSNRLLLWLLSRVWKYRCRANLELLFERCGGSQSAVVHNVGRPTVSPVYTDSRLLQPTFQINCNRQHPSNRHLPVYCDRQRMSICLSPRLLSELTLSFSLSIGTV